jgi:hypothetical protein
MTAEKDELQYDIIPAQSGRYELIEISYKMGRLHGQEVVEVSKGVIGPVIAWRLYRSLIVPGMVAMPIGMGFTNDLDDDWYHSPSKGWGAATRNAMLWYDRKTRRYHSLARSGGGHAGWEAVCEAAIDNYCSSTELKDERKGKVYKYDPPPDWALVDYPL